MFLFLCGYIKNGDGKVSVGASLQHYDISLVALAIILVVLFGDYAIYGLCYCTVNYELRLQPERAEV